MGFLRRMVGGGGVTALSVAAVREWQRVGLPYLWFLGFSLIFRRFANEKIEAGQGLKPD